MRYRTHLWLIWSILLPYNLGLLPLNCPIVKTVRNRPFSTFDLNFTLTFVKSKMSRMLWKQLVEFERPAPALLRLIVRGIAREARAADLPPPRRSWGKSPTLRDSLPNPGAFVCWGIRTLRPDPGEMEWFRSPAFSGTIFSRGIQICGTAYAQFAPNPLHNTYRPVRVMPRLAEPLTSTSNEQWHHGNKWHHRGRVSWQSGWAQYTEQGISSHCAAGAGCFPGWINRHWPHFRRDNTGFDV